MFSGRSVHWSAALVRLGVMLAIGGCSPRAIPEPPAASDAGTADVASAPPGPPAAPTHPSALPDAGSVDAAKTFGESELRGLLASNAPGTAHEAFPHGVPTSYDWYARSRANPTRTDPRLTRLNWWGQVFTDTTGERGDNARVAVREGVVLLLFAGESTWVPGQRTNLLAGGSWSEDFQSHPCGVFDVRAEPDASRSFVPDVGCAAHFWPDVAHIDIGTRALRAVVSVAHVRLVAGDPADTDDLSASRYLVGLGVDWRDPVSGCPANDAGVPICSGAGVGRMIRPTPGWRAVVFSTMTNDDLASLPLPPIAFFQHPDGGWPSP